MFRLQAGLTPGRWVGRRCAKIGNPTLTNDLWPRAADKPDCCQAQSVDRSHTQWQNSNMHLTKVLTAAFAATGYRLYLHRAERIESLIRARHTAGLGYWVAEHFTSVWIVDRDYHAGAK